MVCILALQVRFRDRLQDCHLPRRRNPKALPAPQGDSQHKKHPNVLESNTEFSFFTRLWSIWINLINIILTVDILALRSIRFRDRLQDCHLQSSSVTKRTRNRFRNLHNQFAGFYNLGQES